MLPNSDVVLVRFDAKENKWILYDVYKVASDYTLTVTIFGWINDQRKEVYCNDEDLQLNKEFYKINSRKNLKGVHLPCGSLVN